MSAMAKSFVWSKIVAVLQFKKKNMNILCHNICICYTVLNSTYNGLLDYNGSECCLEIIYFTFLKSNVALILRPKQMLLWYLTLVIRFIGRKSGYLQHVATDNVANGRWERCWIHPLEPTTRAPTTTLLTHYRNVMSWNFLHPRLDVFCTR